MDLTPDQQETLLNFQAITENWDPTISLQLLHRNNWNLEEAINEYVAFTNHLEDFRSTPNQSVYEEPMQTPNLSIYEEPIQTPILRRHTAGPNNSSQKKSFFSKVKSVLGDIMVNPIPVYSQSVESFKYKLQSVSPDLHPIVNTLLLKDVIIYAKDKKKMLAIYIHNKDTSWDYVKDTLCYDLSVMVLNEYYIFWPVEKETIDGEMAEHVLRPTRYPCLAVVNVDCPQPMVLEKQEGLFEPEKVVSFLTRNYIPRPVISQQNKELIQERKLRAQQERELREAERIVEARKLQEQKEKEEKLKNLEEEKQRKIKEEAEKREKIERIGDEPSGLDASFISFRMPDGSKVERRFGKTQKISVLYDFIETLNCLNCELLFGFPAEVLRKTEESLENSGIHPKALLIVRISQVE